MSIQITSNTDSQEVVANAMADQKPVVEKKSASAQKQDETTEDSDASEIDPEDETSEQDQEDESSDEADTDESTEDEPEKKAKRAPGFKRRVDKLRSKITAKEQEVEYWKQEALKRQNVPGEETKQTPAVKADSNEGKPKADNFETHDEYVEALTDWKLDQKLSQKDLELKRAQDKSEYQKQIKSHADRVNAFAEKHDDFKDLMDDVNDVPVSMTVQDIILGSENGPELMYMLAKDKEEFKRICALPAISAARELGKLEAKLAKSSEESKPSDEIKQPNTTTKSPPPPKAISGKGSGSVKRSIYDSNLSQREYEALRNEQEARRADRSL